MVCVRRARAVSGVCMCEEWCVDVVRMVGVVGVMWYGVWECCVDWLVELSVLTISTVLSAQVLTCDSEHSWQLYSAAILGDQVTRSMTSYPIQSHYSDTDLTSPHRILIF